MIWNKNDPLVLTYDLFRSIVSNGRKLRLKVGFVPSTDLDNPVYCMIFTIGSLVSSRKRLKRPVYTFVSWKFRIEIINFNLKVAVASWYKWRHRLTFLNLVMKLLFLLNHNPTLWLLNEHFIWIFMNKTAWHWPDAKLFTVKTSKTGRSKSFSKISALIKYSTCTLKLRTVKVHLVILGRLCYPFAVHAGIWVRFGAIDVRQE